MLLPAAILADTRFGDLDAPSWQQPDDADLRAQIDHWLTTQSLTASERAHVLDHLALRTTDALAYDDSLDWLAELIASIDQRAAQLVTHCQAAVAENPQPDFAWLADPNVALLVRANMRLYYARWLVQVGWYDEALSQLAGITSEQVIDPAALMFYQAIAHHHLVQPDRADALVTRLLERESQLPVRYQQLVRLMRKDTATLQEDSLDHIARRMADIQRRLVQGRAGQKVQAIERGVIESLDKLIEELEKQQQQQSQQGQAGANPSGSPMQDSKLAELKAPGHVDRRNLGGTADWGNLPPKDREQAMQDIGREFPAHYREVIEQYFRELASEPAPGER